MRARMFGVGLALAAALPAVLVLQGLALWGGLRLIRDIVLPARDIAALNGKVVALLNEARFAEALPLAQSSVALTKERHGEDHRLYATALINLASVLEATNRLAEAEPLFRRALAIDEKTYGPDDPHTAISLGNLAGLLRNTNRLADAEPLLRRALAIDEKSYGPDHPSVAIRLSNLATLLSDTNRLAEAESLFRRALAIDEKSLGAHHPNVAIRLNGLANLLRATDRLAEAELLFRRALTINEWSFAPDPLRIAEILNNLALLLSDANRLAEAESLLRRALTIAEKSLGPDHPNVATTLSNLALLLQRQTRLSSHIGSYAMATTERREPCDSRESCTALTNRFAEAEPLLRRALVIAEKSYGPNHPDVANRLHNLSSLLFATHRLVEAEPLLRRALAINEESLGPDHLEVAKNLNNLAVLGAERGDWGEAARLKRRAARIVIGARGGRSDRLAGLARRSGDLRYAARAVYRAGGGSPEARSEGFELAQWELQSEAANALSQMAVRFAKGDGPLAVVVRERQDLVAKREGEDKRLLAAIGNGDAKATATLRASIAGLDRQLGAIDRRIDAEFPDYASIDNPEPLTIDGVQKLLKNDEVLVAYLDVPRGSFGKVPGETLAWAVTRDKARWTSIPLDTAALAGRVARLRCGLDREGNWTWDDQRRRWDGNHETCRELAPKGLADGAPLPLDLPSAHALYEALLAPFVDLTNGKSLIVVPSGPLTSLPFHVLVTRPAVPAGGAPDYRKAAWLALQRPVTVLPSVGSLQVLRKLTPSQANEPYLGFGNPLLAGGAPELAALARAKQTCASQPATERRRVAAADRRVSDLSSLYRVGIDLDVLRDQAALPETSDELCAVARSLGALANEADSVWLGARATETNLKALSRAGKLARHRVLHFATHGVLAGESEVILKAKAEPALILTPPGDGATLAALEEDNGLLTASEVAQLELDADWVVLSACNTAAGDKRNAEALSGLARAFFYAKARALLVSHWYVNSEAAVKIATAVFAELSAHPEIGRAEALRRSMVRLIRSGRSDQAQPEYWAPFVLVGEGAR
jgi:CHAT domain-containing protein/tetratricopeptide (TPR) repeat protein